MTPSLELLAKKLLHLQRMSEYLRYSLEKVQSLGAWDDTMSLTPGQHESLAAFRVRFSEFQEQLGKAMRAIAMEEEQDVDRFGAVLAYMERLEILDSAEHWKLIRELRNAVNHEYEENAERLSAFFVQLVEETPTLLAYHQRLAAWCQASYGI